VYLLNLFCVRNASGLLFSFSLSLLRSLTSNESDFAVRELPEDGELSDIPEEAGCVDELNIELRKLTIWEGVC